MGQYEKDKKELLEKIEQLEHKLKKAKQSGDKDDVDKYSRKLADRTGLDLPFTYVQGRGWSVDSLPAFSPGDVQMFSGCRDDQTSADVVAGGQAGGAMTNAFLAVLDNARHDLKYHELMDALHRELRRKRMSQKPQLSSSQRFDLRDRVFCLTDGFVPNGNANLGRPPRQPGHRPHRKHGQAMGGMNLEDFLAGGGGGMAMAAMGGLLLSMALGDH